MRHRPRPHPRSAPPAPSDTTSAPPARTPGTRPPDNPPSSAPCRTATGARSRGAGMPGPRASAPASVLSMRLEPSGSRPRTTPRPVPRRQTRAPADSPPSAAVVPNGRAPTRTARPGATTKSGGVQCSTCRAAGSFRRSSTFVPVLDQLAVLDTLGFLDQQPDLSRGETPHGSCEPRRPGRPILVPGRLPRKPADQRLDSSRVTPSCVRNAWSEGFLRSSPPGGAGPAHA